MIEENGEMRRKRVSELSAPEKLQYEADVKAKNIILQGVPANVYALTKFPALDSGLAVLVFNKGDNPINAINMMMSFLSTVVTSRFPSMNNQLRNSLNPRQQAMIHDGRVIVQQLQGRQNSFRSGSSRTKSTGQMVVKCFNCQGE
ncbi:hypothetical protein Tco_1427067 [Tanacetum coccineum]